MKFTIELTSEDLFVIGTVGEGVCEINSGNVERGTEIIKSIYSQFDDFGNRLLANVTSQVSALLFQNVGS